MTRSTRKYADGGDFAGDFTGEKNEEMAWATVGSEDSNPRPPALKTGHADYGNLSKLNDLKCFRLNCLRKNSQSLLIPVALEWVGTTCATHIC
jgi:hypothetical protein